MKSGKLQSLMSAGGAFVLPVLTVFQLIVGPSSWFFRKAAFTLLFLMLAVYYAVEYAFDRKRPRFDLLDGISLYFLAVLMLSALISPCRELAFDLFGDEEGAVIWVIYLGAFNLLRRVYLPRRAHFDLFLVFGAAVTLIEILNCCGLFFPFLYEKAASTYVNYNMLTQALGMYLACDMALLRNEEAPRRAALYLAGGFLFFTGIILARSDSAAVILALLFLLPPFLFKTDGAFLGKMMRMLAMAAFAFAAVNLLYRVSAGWKTYLDDDLLIALAKRTPFPVGAAVGLALLGASFFLGRAESDVTRQYRTAALTLAAAFILLLMLVNFGGLDAGKAGAYLKITDEWGTHRGAIWRAGFRAYAGRLTPYEKLFGTGIGSFQRYMTDFCPQYIPASVDISVFSPHNFLLQWLFETGALGLSGYLMLVSVSVAGAVRRRTALGRAALFAVAVYLVSMLLAVPSPETTGLFIVFLAAGCERAERGCSAG